MTVLLLGPFSVLPFFCIAQSLLMQKTTAKLIVLGILYIPPLLGSSKSANPCLCTLSSIHHIWPSSAQLSSQGTVNSMMMIFIVADHKTMSGLKFVGTISGNLSYLSRSTSSCQSLAWSKIPLLVSFIMFPLVVSPSLTNCICIGFFFRVLTSLRCFSITSANSRSTLLCHHVYLPCDKTMAHDEST